MSHNYDRYRFISKAELARLANVSPRTFTRYLATKRQVLNAMGVSPKAQKLPPQAVRYICEDYCIDLPPSLEGQALKLTRKGQALLGGETWPLRDSGRKTS